MMLNTPVQEGYGITRTHYRVDVFEGKYYIVAVIRSITRSGNSFAWKTEESPVQEITRSNYEKMIYQALRLFWDRDNQLRPRNIADFENYLLEKGLSLWLNKKEC